VTGKARYVGDSPRKRATRISAPDLSRRIEAASHLQTFRPAAQASGAK
jgi:hypothetical protein